MVRRIGPAPSRPTISTGCTMRYSSSCPLASRTSIHDASAVRSCNAPTTGGARSELAGGAENTVSPADGIADGADAAGGGTTLSGRAAAALPDTSGAEAEVNDTDAEAAGA